MEIGVYFEFPRGNGKSEHQAFEEEFQHIQLAEKVGFDVAWLAELHFSPERSVISAPLIAAAAIANRTKKIKIGTAVSVLPLNNPVRMAEDMATLDHVTGGRFELGIGRSGATRGYVGYGIPYPESRPRFRECLEVIMKAWTEERFSYHGQFYNYDNVCVIPKPLQKPHPPIRNAASSAGSFPFSGQMGFPIFIGLRGVLDSAKERVDSYKDAWRQAGHTGDPNICIRVPTYVADTTEKAHREAEPSAMNWYKNLVPTLGEPLPGLSDEENADRAARSKRFQNMSYEEFLQTDSAFGSPEAVAERLQELKETFSLTGVMMEANFGGMIPKDKVQRSLTLFAEKVAPKLK
jgi:alkanesulfonate monooxygenase SsuD/methylene tetrahydromethanopterin reductase-like flavin-dependent oxidoreductase (luciferase family)